MACGVVSKDGNPDMPRLVLGLHGEAKTLSKPDFDGGGGFRANLLSFPFSGVSFRPIVLATIASLRMSDRRLV